MKQTLLVTTAAVALAFSAYGAAAQSDRTEHHPGATAVMQQHQAAKPGEAQNQPSTAQNQASMAQRATSQREHREQAANGSAQNQAQNASSQAQNASSQAQNQPSTAQRNPTQREQEQGIAGSSTPPNEAQNAPSAMRQNQPRSGQRELSRHGRHERGMTGASTQPNQAVNAPSATSVQNQPSRPEHAWSRPGRREHGFTGTSHQAGQAQNQPSRWQAQNRAQNQPSTAERNQSPREQRGQFEQGFAGSTAAPLSTERSGAARGSVNTTVPIPQERRAELSQRFARAHLHRVDHVGFSLSVGTVVPRSAALYPLPADIVSVYPTFRGYEYIAVGDRIAIVQPSTMKIVTIIDERGPGGFYGSAAPPRGTIVIPEHVRVQIRERIHRVSLHRVRRVEFPLEVGAFVPPSVPLYVMPPPIVAVDPALSPYRYVVVEDDFVVVDPEVRRIVAILPS